MGGVRQGPGEAIDEPVAPDLPEALQGKGRTGTITDQALQAGVVLAFGRWGSGACGAATLADSQRSACRSETKLS